MIPALTFSGACADGDPVEGNRPPVFGEPLALTIAEGQTRVADLPTASDPDGDAVVYAFGGPDADLFRFVDTIELVGAPDFEAPADADGDGVYSLEAYADDGRGGTATLAIEIRVTDVNEPPTFTSGREITVVENVTDTGYAAAADDPEGEALRFSVEGEDAAALAIDPASGALRFVDAPDFEAPADADADNVYTITIVVTDPGDLTDRLEVTVTVTDDVGNEAPAFTSTSSVSLPENLTATGYVAAATDPEGDAFTFAIDGGPDAAVFSIDSASGALSFLSAPDFEAPADTDADNVYEVTLAVADDEGRSTLDLEVHVLGVNEFDPVFTSGPTGAAAENQLTTDYVATATDGDGQPVTFSITGGADAAAFTLDGTTGMLGLSAPLDFEAPTDADQDNEYEVEITADDGDSRIATLTVLIAVVDDVEPPVFTSTTTAPSPENTTATGYVATASAPGETVVYAVAGGPDAARFDIDGASGALSFVTAPDFEAPTDADADNDYEVVISANATATANLAVTISVTDVDEAPTFTSPTTASLPENQTATGYTAAAADPEGQALTYAVSGGPDQAFFTVDPSTGQVSLVSGLDFEAPQDANADNVYEVTFSASDTTFTVTLDVDFTVVDVGELPVFSSPPTGAAPENGTATGYTAAATTPGGGAVTYAIAGGADAARFVIDPSTGALTFAQPLDFEAASDADGDNVFDVVISATATAGGLAATLAVSITLTDVDEAPVFASVGAGTAAENAATTSYVAVAADPEGLPVSYSVIGGADAAAFGIGATSGALSFASAPDFESPSDANADNVYEVTVGATANGATVQQAVLLTVTDINELPTFTSGSAATLDEGQTATGYTATASDPDGDAITFSLTGTRDDARFSIGATSGALSFITPPNFERPQDDDANNQYVVQITATAGGDAVAQTVTITVNDVNEPPVFASGTSGTAAENQTTTSYTAQVTDPEGLVPTYSISGGADAAAFSISAASGALSFAAPQDFEAPADADGDGAYLVQVSASAGGDTIDQLVTVTLSDVDEAPVFSSPAAVSVAENRAATGYTAQAADPEGGAVTYSITGGADAAAFSISAGALSFTTAPDFEAPTDAGADNAYVVVVTATDGANPVTQTVTVTVTDLPRQLFVDFPPEGANLGGVTSTNITGSITDAPIAQVSSVLVAGQPATLIPGDPVRFTATRAATRADTISYAVQSSYVAGGSDALTRTVANQAPMPFPEFVAYDPSTGDAIVVDTGNNELLRVNLSTGVRTVLSGSASSGTGFSGPRGVAIDAANGRALVVDDGRDTVFAVDLTTGARTVLSTDADPGPNYATPSGVEYDAAGNRLFVVDNGQDALLAVDLTTGAKTEITGLNVGSGPRIFTPNDVAYDPATQTAYVTEDLNDAVIAVNVSTGARVVLSDDTTGTGPTFTRPRGVVLETGRLLVVDDVTDQVIAVDLTTGNRTLVVDDAVGTGPNLVSPFDLALGAAGQLIVVDTNLGVLDAAAASGNRTVVTAPTSVGVGVSLDGSEDLVYDEATRQVLVLDDNQVNAIGLADLSRAVVSSSGRGTGTTFSSLRRGVLDGADLLVTDSTRDAVFRVDLTTGDRTVVSDDNTGAGPVFGNPQGITIDRARNRLLVTDTSLDALVEVNLADGARTVIVGAGLGISDPEDVFYDAGLDRALIVVDGFPNTGVIAFDAVTEVRSFLSGTGSGGVTTGAGPTFLAPTTIDRDATGAFVVSETSRRELLSVNPTSGDRAVIVGAGPSFRGVTAVAVDAPRNRAFVFDQNNNRDTVKIVDLGSGQRAIIAN